MITSRSWRRLGHRCIRAQTATGRLVGIVFSPADHNGIWAGRLEGVKGKGTLPAYMQEVVERIAKEKGLA